MTSSNSVKLNQTIEQVRNYWDERATQAISDCQKVDASLRAQKMRFESFLLNHNLTNKSVLDLGCGVGDFWDHLQARRISCHYLGIDISPQMVNRCRERFPEANFEVQNILQWQPDRKFDYVTAFAIHNTKVKKSQELLESITRRQFELCNLAAHISILTDRYSGFAPHIQAWHAEEVLTLALKITPYVVLHHDYLPNDFSLTLYRQPLIDTCQDLLLDKS